MSNDTKNKINAMEDVDVLLKKGEILTDPDGSREQKRQACESVASSFSAYFSANKPECPEDSPSSSSCSSGPVDWSKVMHTVGNKSEYIANKTFEIEEKQKMMRQQWAEQIASEVTTRVSNNVNSHTTGEHKTTRALATEGFQGIEARVDAANENLEDHITAATEKIEAQVTAANEKLEAQMVEIKEFIQASAQKPTRRAELSDLLGAPVDEVTCLTYDSSAATPSDKEKDEQIASLQNQVKELQRSVTKKRLFEDPLKEEEEEKEAAGVPMMKKLRKVAAGFPFGGKK